MKVGIQNCALEIGCNWLLQVCNQGAAQILWRKRFVEKSREKIVKIILFGKFIRPMCAKAMFRRQADTQVLGTYR
jgi:hypothetical protein